MDEEQFLAWSREGAEFNEAAWARGDEEAFLRFFADDLVVTNNRSLSASSGTGLSVVRENWALREVMPRMELRIQAVRAPDLTLSRMTAFDDNGYELVSISVFKLNGRGQVAEATHFDDSDLDEAWAKFEQLGGRRTDAG